MESTTSQSTHLNEVYNTAQFRAMGHQLVEMIANHLDTNISRENEKVIPYASPEEELNFWQKDLHSDSNLLDVFQNILSRSISVHHPRYIGHQVSVPALLSSLTGLLSEVLSNGTGVYEMGMASNALEKIIGDLMAKYIGYTEKASGLMTSGGTLANLTALLAARKAKAPSPVWEIGHRERLAVMVSEEAHYCIDRAVRVMGFGKEGIIKVPVDHQFKIKSELLEEYYQDAKNKGLHVIALVGCASSTATGSYDDLGPLADFCEQKKLWFHVDGAHGGGVVFSKQYKHLVRGINRADSVVIDFHKMLLTPALSTALIFKNGKRAYQTFAQRAQYLWDSQDSEEWYNSGKRTFECTKFMMSIKVYAIVKSYGLEIFEKNIDYLYNLASQFAKMIEERPSFELALMPEANIVNFRYLTKDTRNENELNSQIRQKLIESGKFYIVQTQIKEQRFLRTALMNGLTTENDLKLLLDEIERLGRSLEF